MMQLMAQPGPSAGAGLGDVRVRPYGIGDGDRLRAMSARLSKQSLYTRFWSGVPHIPEDYVRRMATLDHWDREALVALLDGEMLGIAEYVRDPARPHLADLAVLVADPWQQRGLGRLLVACLAPLAQRRGVTEFGAEIILENRRAMRAVHGGWPDARSAARDGAAHYNLPLPVPRRVHPGLMGTPRSHLP
jgi:GNAT superfamily N-acetyltransferase